MSNPDINNNVIVWLFFSFNKIQYTSQIIPTIKLVLVHTGNPAKFTPNKEKKTKRYNIIMRIIT